MGQATDHAWLFPGSRPGTHLSSHQLNARLKTLGIDARAARNTTLLDLAAQLPAAVLSSLLGLGITTPTAWTHHAGHRTGYAAELAQRQPSSHQPRTVPFGRCTTCENSPRHAGDRYAAR